MLCEPVKIKGSEPLLLIDQLVYGEKGFRAFFKFSQINVKSPLNPPFKKGRSANF